MRCGYVLAVTCLCMVANTVSAADSLWDGGAFTGSEATKSWDLPANWDPDGTPAAGQFALIAIGSPYAVASADLAGAPAVEVAIGGLVAHKNGVTLTSPLTLSGGTWHLCPDLNYYGWGPDRALAAGLMVTAPSYMKGGRGNTMRIDGPLAGAALLTFQGTDSYLGDGPDWVFRAADSTFSGGILIEANNSPVVRAAASGALGTGDITVRATGKLVFAATQDYTGAARTPVLRLEGGATGMSDHLAGAVIPFDVVVESPGGTLGGGYWASGNTYSGSVTLHGPLTLAGGRLYGGANTISITGPISGPHEVKVNTTDSYNGGRGMVALDNPANTHSATTILRGYLRATSEGALSTGPITLHSPDTMGGLFLDKPTDADWTLANDLAGTGPIQVEGGSGHALTLAGAISPGAAAGEAGTITVKGDLAFAAGASLTVDLSGADPLNPAADQIAVTGSVGGLSELAVTILPAGDVSAIAGRLFTIVSCANDLTGQTFGSITVPTGWQKVISYEQGAVKIAIAPEGGEDVVAPAAVIDLAAGDADLHSLTLTWTAPGDDGVMGTAASYDIRYSTSEISEATWDSAAPVAGVPAPAASGTPQSIVVGGLTMGTTYYFAIKTSDEVPNTSLLSNVAEGLTAVPDTFPPAAVTDLVADTPSADSLTLTWTAPGDDGNVGTASAYDIRYAATPITDDNWDAAAQVAGEPSPTPAGTIQSIVVTGLTPSTTWYFALKSIDEVPNVSPLSNVAVGTTAPPDPVEASKRVLGPNDFTYKGYYVVPTGGSFAETHYGQGFTHRYIDGQLRFLTLSFFGNRPGGGYQLIEFTPPAELGAAVTFTNHWPDIWTGTGLGSGGVWSGLWYEQAQERLWTTWAIDYPDDVQAAYTKSLAVRRLNENGTITDAAGPWGLTGVQQRRIYGGLTAIPQWFQDFYGVATYGVGWGGYASRMGLGVSLGPTFYAIPDPALYAPGDIPAGDFRTLMDHSSGTRMTDWYASGHPTSFDRGVRNSDVINEYDGGYWLSPAPDGLGRWTWGDSNWNTGCWIELPTRHGFVTVPKFSSGRAWYETSTLHCQRQTAEIQVFDPRVLGEVARGTRQVWNTYPANRWEITGDCSPLGLMDGIGGNGPSGGPAGASYDPLTRQLYVYCIRGSNLKSYVLVYDVGPIPGDVNGDGHVNAIDLLHLAHAFATTSGDPDYDINCDFNGDGAINVIDLLTLAGSFGQ